MVKFKEQSAVITGGKAEDGWGMFRCLMESAPVFISIRHNNAMCLVLYL